MSLGLFFRREREICVVLSEGKHAKSSMSFKVTQLIKLYREPTIFQSSLAKLSIIRIYSILAYYAYKTESPSYLIKALHAGKNKQSK